MPDYMDDRYQDFKNWRKDECPLCGSTNCILVGYYVEEAGELESFECLDCHYVWEVR